MTIQSISIHAPSRERLYADVSELGDYMEFQSTLPRGSDWESKKGP